MNGILRGRANPSSAGLSLIYSDCTEFGYARPGQFIGPRLIRAHRRHPRLNSFWLLAATANHEIDCDKERRVSSNPDSRKVSTCDGNSPVRIEAPPFRRKLAARGCEITECPNTLQAVI